MAELLNFLPPSNWNIEINLLLQPESVFEIYSPGLRPEALQLHVNNPPTEHKKSQYFVHEENNFEN